MAWMKGGKGKGGDWGPYSKGGSKGGWGGGGGGWGDDYGFDPSMMMNMMAMMGMMGGGGKGGGMGKGAGGGKGGKGQTRHMGEFVSSRGDASPEEVQAFIEEHSSLQSHAISKFKQLSPTLQRLVIDKGSMTDARDVTAVLIGRITALKNMKPGDWVCPGCSDIQFSNKDKCKMCGHEKDASTGMQTQVSKVSAKGVEPADPSEVDAFIAEYPGLQDHAIRKLRDLDPILQRVVIAKGSMADAREPTAVLIKRCATALNMRPGDWICSKCNDIVFSYKAECSQCKVGKY